MGTHLVDIPVDTHSVDIPVEFLSVVTRAAFLTAEVTPQVESLSVAASVVTPDSVVTLDSAVDTPVATLELR